MRYLSKLFLILIFCTESARAETPFPGPIELGDQYPLDLAQPASRPKRASGVSAGKSRLVFVTAWTNTSLQEDHYTIDAETFLMETGWRYGLGGGWDIGILIPMRVEGGGTLDSVIEDWHGIFGLPGGDREKMPRKRHDVSGDSDGGFFQFGKSGFGFGSPEVSANYCMTSDCLSLTLGLPSPSVDFGQQALAFSPGWVSSFDYDALSVSVGASAWYYGDRSIDRVKYRAVIPKGFLSFEYLITQRWQIFSTIFGGLQETKKIPGQPDAEMYFDFGSRVAVGERSTLDFMVRENPVGGHGSADISFVVALQAGL